jgi:hypothetical protein
MSQQTPDRTALTPDTRKFLETVLGELAVIHKLTEIMSKQEAVESLLKLLEAGAIKLGYDDELEELSIILQGDFEWVALH